MKTLLILRRAFVINRVMIKYGLEEFLAPTPLSKFSLLLKFFALSRQQNKNEDRGTRLNKALTELGPIFVKLGQMLSTRRDLLPDDLSESLAKLQDRVEPFSNQLAIQTIEKQLGKPINEIFESFDETPLASASVAQVHSAQLLRPLLTTSTLGLNSGHLNSESLEKATEVVDVVVKIIRPGIKRKMVADLKLLHVLAGWFESYSEAGKRIHPKQIIKDYQSTLFNELDLTMEAANTTQLKRNFESSKLLYVPNIYWEQCKQQVMVQEKITGVPIGQVQTLIDSGVNMKKLAHRGVEIFFTQVFRDSYFHADMHPGNIFVNINDPENPSYIAIDCGIMGTLNQSDKRYLAQNFVAFFNRDYRQIAELHVQSGWVSNKVSIEEFESAIRTACEPIFGKSLDEVSFGHFLIQLFQTARRFEMEVQPQLVLLQKTLLYIEGLGRQLYPKLDLWETAQPFLTQWLADTYGPKAAMEKIKQNAPKWLSDLPEIPEKISAFLNASNQQSNQQTSLIESIEQLKDSQKSSGKAIRWALLGISFMLASLSSSPEWLTQDWLKGLLIGLSLTSFVVSFSSN
jgi:ubiquinone biosynthesis protein